jgi:hypothetical protein
VTLEAATPFDGVERSSRYLEKLDQVIDLVENQKNGPNIPTSMGPDSIA